MIQVPETTSKRIIEKVQNGKIAEMDFSPQLYNIWNFARNKREQLEKDRDSKVIDLWLQCYTYSDIERLIQVPETTSKRIIEKVQSGKIAETDFSPQLYNIWNFARNNNENVHL